MLQSIAWVSLILSFLCAAALIADEIRRPQKMMVMNFVWPITALYFSVFAVWAYFRAGRAKEHSGHSHAGVEKDAGWGDAALSDTHCGAGCALGDVIAEFGVFALGLTLLGHELYASYAADLAVAWLLGIVFQYFSIKPMGDMSSGEAIIAAIKADTLSILAFQVGMYLWMALVYFVLFPGPHLKASQPAYWLMMQIAMVCGYVTALPVNLWLLRIGIKHPMHH